MLPERAPVLEDKNKRVAEVRRNLWKSPHSSSLVKKGPPIVKDQSWLLNKDRNSTTALGNLCQSTVTLRIEKLTSEEVVSAL